MSNNGSEKIEIIITDEMADKRMDAVLADLFQRYTRSYIQKMFAAKKINCNGKLAKKSYVVTKGDVITLEVEEPKILRVEAANIPLDVVYEDDDLIVINKPAGMVVHPGPGNYKDTMVNALMYHCRDNLSSINGVIRPGIVHRIDKDTSGLIMAAKNNEAHISLSKQLAEHTVTRRYTAIVYNNIKEENGVIDEPIGRDPKEAITQYKVLERYGKFTLIEAVLKTGRTHQIRVHMSYINHPLLGDDVYGPAKNKQGAKRQMLHAGVLGFMHPRENTYMEFIKEVPSDFDSVLRELRKHSSRS